MTTYKGFEVFTDMPNQRDGRALDVLRPTYELDNDTGLYAQEQLEDEATVAKTYTLLLDTRAAVQAFRQFLLRCDGRRVPFWIPTWQSDFVLATAPVESVETLVVKQRYYTRFLFSATGYSRRHLAVIGVGSMVFRGITTATDNGDGTESIGIVAPGATVAFGAALLSLLLFVRLDTDLPELQWWTQDLAEAEVPVRLLGKETPAP